MIQYVNIPKTESFIYKVFQYYNGRINTCNLARLEINWVGLYDRAEAGLSRNPNLVIINPHVVARYTDDEFTFYFVILETIIHELYHQDQMIDYIKMASDPNYVTLIESAVEIQTNIYIANHINEILYNFGIDASRYGLEIYRENISLFEYGYHYKRRTWFDHILIALREVIYYFDTFTDVSDDLKKILDTGVGDFKISINGIFMDICKNGIWVNIQTLNDFLYETFFSHTVRTIAVTYGRDGWLEINAELKNKMC